LQPRLTAAAAAVAPSPAAGAASAPAQTSLASLDLCPVITQQGLVQPDVPEGTAATVFAIYDNDKRLQYVGFSKDLRSSLRTVLGRRPDRAHQYRALHFPKLDQEAMVAVRTAWFEENSGPPPGNKRESPAVLAC
jgi:hypothetical protein